VATSQEEAIALVRKAKENGFTGVKLYGTFNPAWLPATIAEALRLGLHVHGHIPAGIRPLEAVNDGYDEVTHINWIVMQAVPASVLPTDNGIGRFEAPGRYAKDMDVNDPALTELISRMAAKHIYSDPTMVAFEGLYVPDNGDVSPAYAPFVGTLPPMVERGFRTGGFAVPKDLTRADYRASWAKMVQILNKMHQAGVPIVAGTDGSGLEIVHELEIYEQAGFTPAETLAAATIVPARLVRQDTRHWSRAIRKRRSVTCGRRASSCSMARCWMRMRCDSRLVFRAGRNRWRPCSRQPVAFPSRANTNCLGTLTADASGLPSQRARYTGSHCELQSRQVSD
jgi:hypothetical protein